MKNLKPSELIIFTKLKNILVDYDKSKYTKENMLILKDLFVSNNHKFVEDFLYHYILTGESESNNSVYNFYHALFCCFVDLGISIDRNDTSICRFRYLLGDIFSEFERTSRGDSEWLKKELEEYNYVFLHTEFVKYCNKSLGASFILLSKNVSEWKKFFNEEYQKYKSYPTANNFYFTSIGIKILKEHPELTQLDRVCSFIDTVLSSSFVKDEYVGNCYLKAHDWDKIVSIDTLINYYAFNTDSIDSTKESKYTVTIAAITSLIYLERSLNKLLSLHESNKLKIISTLIHFCMGEESSTIDREKNPAKFVLLDMESLRNHLIYACDYKDEEYFSSARFNLFYSLRRVWKLLGIEGNIGFVGKGKSDPDPEFDYCSEFSTRDYMKDLSIAVYLFIYAIIGKSVELIPYRKEILSFLIDRLFDSYQKYYEDYGDYLVGNMTVWRKQNDIRILDCIKILINSRDCLYSTKETVLEEIGAIDSILNGETSKEIVTNFFENLDGTKKLFQELLIKE